MVKYIVGSDRTGGAEECLSKIVTELKKGDKEVIDCGVTPNTEANFRKHGKKDDIGIFVVNGVCLGTMLSCNEMVEGGICSQVIFAMPKPLMASPFNDESAYTNEGYKLALVNDGSNWKNEWYSKYNKKYTVDGICNELEGISYCFGETCESLGQKLLTGSFGTSGNGESSSESSSDSETKEPTPMSYADMIKDLISVWDGDVEVKIKQNKMYINKIPQPKPKLWIIDGDNVVSGQAKVKDYNSDTINVLNVNYNEGQNTITIKDEYLINRFGEVGADITAEKIVTDYTGDSTSVSTNREGQDSNGTAEQSEYTQIADVLQKYYTVNDKKEWNTLINKVRFAKTGDEIGNIIKTLTKKKGQEQKSYTDVRHELQKIKDMGY